MISGPVQPNTIEALLATVQRYSEQIESGLEMLAEGLALPCGERVDAIARDASGRAVFVLLTLGDEAERLLARVLAARAFLGRNRMALDRALPDLGVHFGRGTRIAVIGLHIPDQERRDLARVGGDDLEVYQVEVFGLGGSSFLSAQALNGPAAGGAENSLDVPSGLSSPELRSRCGALLGVLERLDPELDVFGDRFSRRVDCRGELLCRLRVDRDGVQVAVGERRLARLEDTQDLLELGDAVLRRYLELIGPDAGGPQGTETADPDGERPLLSLEPLRKSVAETRVSREEFSALGDDAPVTEGGGALPPD